MVVSAAEEAMEEKLYWLLYEKEDVNQPK